jgi:hypothetical protein
MQVFLHVPTMEKPDSDDEELSIKVSVSARLQTKESECYLGLSDGIECMCP